MACAFSVVTIFKEDNLRQPSERAYKLILWNAIDNGFQLNILIVVLSVHVDQLMGRAKQKEREWKRSVATCQRLDKLFQAKRSKKIC